MDRKGILMALGLVAFAIMWFQTMGPSLNQPAPQEIVENEDKGSKSEGTVAKDGQPKSLDDTQSEEGAAGADPENSGSDSDPADPGSNSTPETETAKTPEAETKFDPLPAEKLETDKMAMTVDPQRGITQVELLEHTNDDRKTTVKIGSEKHPGIYLVKDGWKFGKPEVSRTEKSVKIIRPVLGTDLAVIQNITVDKDYHFTTSFTFVNRGSEPLNVTGVGLNCGNMRPLSENVGMMAGMDQAVDIFDIEEEGISTELFQDILKDLNEIESTKGLKPGTASYLLEKPEKGFQWIAVKNRYFAWIVDLESGFENCEVSYNVLDENLTAEEQSKSVKLVTAVGKIAGFNLAPGESKEFKFDCYSGPQELANLSEMSHDKKGVMQLNLFMWYKVGWIGVISEVMLRALLWLYSYVGNYGVAIILLTIIVKGLFWRLTNKSTESMKKMSTLSPKMKEINEKYKDNPQVKNQEVMKLYRENGVNPVAGCLPLFLQMPVFIALFNAFRGAIELRHSEFLWVSDLSQPDTIFHIASLPVRPLAIAWAVTMLLQQKIVPSSADPTQKKIMMFMPVFMLFVCYGMPSGLTLYWTFSTVMSIMQYYLYNKKHASETKDKTAAG